MDSQSMFKHFIYIYIYIYIYMSFFFSFFFFFFCLTSLSRFFFLSRCMSDLISNCLPN